MSLLLLKRAVSAIFLFIAVTTLAFFLTNLGGTDPGRSILGPQATPEAVDATNRTLGVDRPLLVQYVDWAGDVLHGDLGRSYLNNRPVSGELATHLPVSMSLMGLSLLVVAAASLALAVLAATGRGRADRAVQLISLAGHAIPGYLLALLLLTLFAVHWHIFPVLGYTPMSTSPGQWLWGMVLPVLAVSLSGISGALLQGRGALLDVLDADYMRTLRSRGISSRSVLWRHALRNAAPPWLTAMSLGAVAMLGGSFMVEKVFAIPGLGTLAVNSTISGDRPVLMGLVVLTSGLVILVNLLTDLAQMWLTPKARTQ
ncbi:ABC transporter permease [Nocardia uniformis]|uniref:ABC transporter permease n=1 Tax=Nocardia uniformis TaxID=53432 RepID=A0A849BVY8_9NOCA|nr:ABC transporter permease [Nocardia uniformis]NNH69278.1 ABC transporter permease [Nocardia uniformis]